MVTTIKSIFLVIMPGLILGCLVGCSTARPDLSGLINEGNEVRIYEVFGMDCPGCHGGLENLVNKIPGVKISKANWQKQRLQVVLIPNAEVDDKAVYEAIRRANFTPGERLN